MTFVAADSSLRCAAAMKYQIFASGNRLLAVSRVSDVVGWQHTIAIIMSDPTTGSTSASKCKFNAFSARALR
ncbi:hypothetical protein D9M72_474600 [compost metagenome]